MLKRLLSLILLLSVGFVGCKRYTDDIDGGVITQYQADVPKAVESDEITEFHTILSLLTRSEAEDEKHRIYMRVYTLDAVLANGEVRIKYDWYDRHGNSDTAEYKADADFMAKLQEIVIAHNFAQYNGYYYKVSGLPDMYGELLDIVYASGEQIYAYDNQSSFLSFEAAKELILLFGAATMPENENS